MNAGWPIEASNRRSVQDQHGEASPISQRKYHGAASYGLNDFDKYMCLSVGRWTWYVVAFLMRPYLVLVLSFSDRSNRMGLVDLIYPDRLWLAIDTLAALPAVLIVVAYMNRKPGAKEWVSKIWRTGRTWLLASAGANAAVAVASLLLIETTRTSVVSPLMLCVSIWSLWYLVVSKRLPDAFGDFPEDEPEDGDETQGPEKKQS